MNRDENQAKDPNEAQTPEAAGEGASEPSQSQCGRTGFDALDVAVDFVELAAPLLERIRTADRSLADQAKRAAQSLVLNVAEGRRRRGQDRKQCFRIASGSGEEVRAALRVALAWRYLTPAAASKPLGLLDRVLAMLWRLGA